MTPDDVLAGVCNIARLAGLPVPAGLRLVVDASIRPGAGACARIVDGVPEIAVRALPASLAGVDAIGLRGVLLHELAHHIAGLEHNHREPFRRVLATLASATGQPQPTRCQADPRSWNHPRRWTGAARVPSWLRGGTPRRMSQVRRVLGLPRERVTKPAHRRCSTRQALMLALAVGMWAAAL